MKSSAVVCVKHILISKSHWNSIQLKVLCMDLHVNIPLHTMHRFTVKVNEVLLDSHV